MLDHVKPLHEPSAEGSHDQEHEDGDKPSHAQDYGGVGSQMQVGCRKDPAPSGDLILGERDIKGIPISSRFRMPETAGAQNDSVSISTVP